MTTEKTAAIEGMFDINTLAASKAVAAKIAKAAREGVEPGKYEVSFDVHVEGSVTVGEDYETRLVNKAKPWNLVLVALTEMNKAREAAGMTGMDIGKLVEMAENMDPKMVKEAQNKAEAEAAAIKAETLSTAKGKVTTKLAVTPL